jgi:hypothetical protein
MHANRLGINPSQNRVGVDMKMVGVQIPPSLGLHNVTVAVH